MVRFLLVAALSIMMDGTALAADAARVQALDTVAGTYKPVKGTDSGDGITVILATGSAPGTSVTVKIKQPDVLEFVGEISVAAGPGATLLAAADARTDHIILGGFSSTTATVFVGHSTVTTVTGLDIVTGSPPVTFTTSAAIYGRVVGPASQIVRVWRVRHSVAP